MKQKLDVLLIVILILSLALFVSAEPEGEKKQLEVPSQNCTQNCSASKQGALTTVWCNDTDGGMSYFTPGEVFSNHYPKGKKDLCYTFPNGKTYLFEGLCRENRYLINQKSCTELGRDYFCEGTKGICASNTTPNQKNNFTGLCNDTDGGMSFFTPGEVFSNRSPNGLKDHCYTFPDGKTYLFEGICRNNEYAWVQKSCTELGQDYFCERTQGICVQNATASRENNSTPSTSSVRDFGAVGDGIKDDGAAFQNALDAASSKKGGGKVFIPAGTYFLNRSLLIGNNTEVYGMGKESILIRSDVYNLLPWYDYSQNCRNGGIILKTLFWNKNYNCGDENISLHHFTIDGSRVTQFTGKVPVYLPNGTFAYQGTAGGGQMGTIAFSAVKDLVIESLTIRNVPQDAIFVRNGGVNTIIRDNLIDGFNLRWYNGGGINLEYWTRGNMLTTKEAPVIIERNTIIARQSNTCYGSETKMCSTDKDCGDNYYACPATSKCADLKGCMTGEKCPGLCGSVQPSRLSQGVAIAVSSHSPELVPYVKIRDNILKLSNMHTGISCIGCQNSLIEGNRIEKYDTDTAGSGLFRGITAASSEKTSQVKNLTIKNNQIIGSGRAGDGVAISLYGTSNLILQNNEVKNKNLLAGYAVFVGYFDHFQINDNTITGIKNGHGLQIGNECQSLTQNGIVSNNEISVIDESKRYKPISTRGVKSVGFKDNRLDPNEKVQVIC